jgi:hypothetical protein
VIGLILGQWRAALSGLLAAGLIIAALTVNGWRSDAQAKATAEVERDAAVERERAAGGDCALGVDGVRDLNAARGAQLPSARRLADDGPRISRSDTP